MLNPGDYSLADLPISSALAAVAQTPIENLEGMKAVTIDVTFAYGSGGTSCKVWIQISTDGGTRWRDIRNFAFTTANATQMVNHSGLTPVTTAITPTDGAMADNQFQDGILGSMMRAKITSVGTYSNTLLSVKITTR